MIYERLLSCKENSIASRFCELELLKEVFYSWDKHSKFKSAKSGIEHGDASSTAPIFHLSTQHSSPQLQRALRFIEENLHTTPVKNVWRRRLQEAKLLLLTGSYTILEVAHHARFSSGAAFNKAYLAEFGDLPRGPENAGRISAKSEDTVRKKWGSIVFMLAPSSPTERALRKNCVSWH